MTGSTLTVEPLNGSRFGLIADAHVHPGGGPELPAAVLEAFAGVDGVFALGDMGDAAGLDALEAVAPVYAVRGADDAEDDPRRVAERRVFIHGGRFIGAVFDGTRHGLLESNDPVTAVSGFATAARTTFGHPVSIVLCAASHKPFVGWCDGILLVNPGSPNLADECTVALLHLAEDHAGVQHVTL